MASKAKGFGWLAALFAAGVWVFCCLTLAAQDAGEVAANADAVIEQMSRAAGVIFAGQVTAVRRPVGFAGSSEGVVEVDFRVDLAVRGPAAGAIYTLREWVGLWSASNERYRVGRRLLVFLYKPGAKGLSSPVHGTEGLVPLRGGGIAPGPDDTSAAQAEWMVDLRWLQAQTVRSAALPALPVHRPVSPRPVRGIVSESEQDQWAAKFTSIPPIAGDKCAMDRSPSHQSYKEFSPARRLPDPWPLPAAAPVEAEPLMQVIALCQQTMKGPDAVR